MMRILMNCTLQQMLYGGDEFKESKKDEACHTYEEDKVHAGVWWGNLREKVD
jgi:hypothetical protein